MKKIVLFGLLLLAISCQDSRDHQSPSNTFNREVGQAIPTDVAYRWIRQIGNTQARTDVHTLPAAQLHDLLPATTGFVGVTLHHALDNTGASHILITPVAEDGTLWSVDQVWDATAKQWLELAIAESWANRFREANPTVPQYHFFGSNLFDTLLANSSLDVIEIVPAVNDKQEPQLLLFVWSGNATGKVQGLTLTVYDKSNPCPPWCGSSN